RAAAAHPPRAADRTAPTGGKPRGWGRTGRRAPGQPPGTPDTVPGARPVLPGLLPAGRLGGRRPAPPTSDTVYETSRSPSGIAGPPRGAPVLVIDRVARTGYYMNRSSVTRRADNHDGDHSVRPRRYSSAGAHAAGHVRDPAPAPPGQRAGGLEHRRAAVHAPAVPLVRPPGGARRRRRGRDSRRPPGGRRRPGRFPPRARDGLLSGVAARHHAQHGPDAL